MGFLLELMELQGPAPELVTLELVLLERERYLQHLALGLAPEGQALVHPGSEEKGFEVPAKQLDLIQNSGLE